MKETFTKWYSKFDKSGNQARLENRLKIITNTDSDKDIPSIQNFIEYAMSKGSSNKEIFTYLSTKVSAYEGETHVLNNQEAIILCCGVVGQHSKDISSDDHLKTNLILSLLSYRSNLPPLISELALDAKLLLLNESVSDREKLAKKIPLKKSIAELLDSHTKQNNISGAGQELLQILQSLQNDILSLSSQVSRLREENQLLWWEKTQRLLSFNIEAASLKPNHRIIPCAYDIYQISLYSSLPASSPQLILKSFKTGQAKIPKTLTLKSLLDGLDIKIATTIFDSIDSIPSSLRGYCPIMSIFEDAYKEATLKKLEAIKLPKLSETMSLEFPYEDMIDIVLCEISLVMIGE